MGEQPATAIECIADSGNGVRVEFTKKGDRFTHTILRVTKGESHPLLQSVEGTSADVSPPSPPLVELHCQEDVVFLSGATTIGHWSMSIERVEQRLVFDVACRLRTVSKRLGSSYQVHDLNYREWMDFNIEHAKKRSVLLNLVRIEHIDPLPNTFPTTLQWRYGIASNK